MRDRPQTYRTRIRRRLAEGDVHASAMCKRIVSACDTACARCSNAQRMHAMRAGQLRGARLDDAAMRPDRCLHGREIFDDALFQLSDRDDGFHARRIFPGQ